MSESSIEDPCTENPLAVLIKSATIKDSNLVFTIQMKTILPQYTKKETEVTRSHADFEWLHKAFLQNPRYTGIIIPPCPPKTNFYLEPDSIAFHTDDQNPDSEEFKKMRDEYEREYLAIFKKAVTLHYIYLARITRIPSLRSDPSFVLFLTLEEQINSKTSLTVHFKDWVKSLKTKVDDNILYAFSSVQEPDRFFEQENHYLANYSAALKNAVSDADSMTRSKKALTNNMIGLSIHLASMATSEQTKLARIYEPLSVFFDRFRKIEIRLNSDEDLRLSDTLRFHHWNAEACKELLLRRIKSYIASENSFKALTKAKQKNDNVPLADDQYQQDLKRFEEISESAKSELSRDATERVIEFRKSLTNYCELQISQLQESIGEIQLIIDRIQAED